jgi:hypothetical protein
MTIRDCWRVIYLGKLLKVIGIFKTLFTSMFVPATLMRWVFTRINFKGFILSCGITSLKRILIALSSSINIKWTRWLAKTFEMMKASSYGKFTLSLSSRVNIRGWYHVLGRWVVVRTYFSYIFFPFPLSPLADVPPKMTLIFSKTWLGWLDSSLPYSVWVSLFTNYWI